MIINFSLWQTDTLGAFGTQSYTIPASGSTAASVIGLRTLTNPTIDTLSFFGNLMSGLPQIPMFEFTLATIVVIGALYYFISERGRLKTEAVAADAATGEATIA